MLRMYKDGGQLPVWELAANYTGCMIGYHSVPVIVDAEQWGIDGWDHGVALSAMVQAADSMHLGLDAYAELGFIPSDHEHESVSKTLNTRSTTRASLATRRATVKTNLRRNSPSGRRRGKTS